jgi:hypothetical protein
MKNPSGPFQQARLDRQRFPAPAQTALRLRFKGDRIAIAQKEWTGAET